MERGAEEGNEPLYINLVKKRKCRSFGARIQKNSTILDITYFYLSIHVLCTELFSPSSGTGSGE